jgi:hypothetical protein
MSMSKRGPRYPREEFARRGDEWYEKIRPLVESGNHGRIVAIDIETGEYELADDVLAACDALYARVSDPQPWCVRIGFPAVHKFGSWPPSVAG